MALIAGVAVVAAAPASAAPMWTITPSPSPAGPTDGNLGDVTCPSATSCFAVGYEGDGGPTLAEHWNGTNWSVMTTPDRSGSTTSTLIDVSCASTANCNAVGDYVIGGSEGTVHTLVEHWNGTIWSIVASPDPTGSTFSSLRGVSCASTTTCYAVGESDSSKNSALVEHWNGTKWSIVTSPSPTGSTFAELDHVSCPGTTSCYAVGDYQTDSSSNTLVEHWNGTTWSIETTPNPTGSTFANLRGVSCPSTTSCTAVGFYDTSSERTLVEHWNGSTWSIAASPNPTGSTVTDLYGVSCPSTTSCDAVGSFRAGSTGKTLVEQWNGTAWTRVTSPAPSAARASDLNGVACPSTTSCNAVGDYEASRASGQADEILVERWNGTTWAIAAPPPASSQSELAQVSCPSTTSCFAVGDDLSGSSAGDQSLVEHWNGTSWSGMTTPNPSPSASSDLSGVSCPSTTNCNAVGRYVAGSTINTLVEHWNGTAWSVVTSPNPNGSDANYLFGVSCPSTTSCNAVGDSFGGATDTTLVEHWNGTTWAIVASPTPSGADTPNLSSVSCPTTTNCTTVGGYSASDSTDRTLVEHWNGTSWAIVASPNPGAGAADPVLTGVSCRTTTSCYAVGNIQINSTPSTFVEHWNGTTWSIVTSPNPSGATLSNLSGVSCASTTNCYAVGDSDNGSTDRTLVERWNGTTWSIIASPNPNGSTFSILNGVSCASTTNCTAVGAHGSQESNYTLTERFA